MIRFVRFLKLVLFFIGVGWAVYSANAFIFLAKTFPSSSPASYGWSDLIASVQGYTVVFGPAIITAVLLIIRWPTK